MLVDVCKIAFDLNDGVSPRRIRMCEAQTEIGTLPTPNLVGFTFVGWYTKPTVGEGFRIMEHDKVEKSMVLYAHWNKVHRRVGVEIGERNLEKWEDDTKNQTSLLPGSEGYEDYIEDLEENAADRPDDEMHMKLEAYNEQLAEQLAEKASMDMNPDRTRKIAWQQGKRSQMARIQSEMSIRAKQTETTLDDALLEKLERSDSLIYDDSVTPDSYEAVQESIVFGE